MIIKNMYDEAWFKKRAFEVLRKIGDNEWDFSDSLLAYIPGSENEYKDAQNPNTIYAKVVTLPERKYLKNIASKMADLLPREFEYIDLGPGTEHKELFLFEEIKKQNKRFIYRPVDINTVFLKLAKDFASSLGIEVMPIHSTFEELPGRLGSSNKPRFVSLGLTYTNYLPEYILRLLKTIAGNSGKVFVEVQIRDRIDIDEVKLAYENDLYKMVRPRLNLIGLDPMTDVEKRYCDDGIRIWCLLKKSTEVLEKMGINAGTKLMTFQSLRSTVSEYENDIKKVFTSYDLIDIGDPFVGAILG